VSPRAGPHATAPQVLHDADAAGAAAALVLKHVQLSVEWPQVLLARLIEARLVAALVGSPEGATWQVATRRKVAESRSRSSDGACHIDAAGE
jgi:hypothetical protein